MDRIAIIGVTGAGKSTLAAQLSACLSLPLIELDALHWDTGWQAAPPDVFRQRVDAATSAPRWVLAGNYGQVRDLVWPRADTLVWLDYTLPFVLQRLFRRTVRRLAHREVLWNGNRERFADNFLKRHSLFLWALETHPKMRRNVPEQLRQPAHRHLVVHRFTRPAETTAWRTQIACSGA